MQLPAVPPFASTKHTWIWGGMCQRRRFALAAAKQLLAVGFFAGCHNHGMMIGFLFFFLARFFASVYSFIDVVFYWCLLKFMEFMEFVVLLRHWVLEPYPTMLHTKAQALATKVAFWRRDLRLLCAGGLLARDSYCMLLLLWHTKTRMMQCSFAMSKNLQYIGIYCHGRVWGATSVVATGLSQQLRHEATWCLCVACPSAVEGLARPL